MEWTYTLNELPDVARSFLSALGDARLIALHGPMGAGKTTFVHALCDVLKVTSPVGSPTFSIINEYSSPGGPVYHIDLYRIRDEEEAIQAGVEDCMYSGRLCLVEWPEKAPGLFPSSYPEVFIEVVDPVTRKLKLHLP